MTTIKLEHADICIDCDVIFDARMAQACPKCASKAVYPVARFSFAIPLSAIEPNASPVILQNSNFVKDAA